MDKHFLEFWGNLLLQAAQGQAQIEKVNQWLSQGFKGAQDLTDLFKRIYNLDADNTPRKGFSNGFQQAAERFNEAYKDYLALMDVVPGERYRELEAQNAELQTDLERLQQEIDRLRGRPSANSAPTEEIVADFQALLQKQQRAFQDLTRQFSGTLEQPPPSQSKEKPAKKA